MPLYEYQCTACHRRTEKIQKFSDPELTVCPHCGGPLERTVTAAAFAFAGGGWYKDGYGSSAKPAAGGDPADSGSSGSQSADTSSASPATPAATPATAPAPAAAAPAAATTSKP